METNEKGKNFIRNWIVVKALVSTPFILAGLLLQNERAIFIGCTFGGLGLLALLVMVVSIGPRSTFRSFKVLFQSVSKKIR